MTGAEFEKWCAESISSDGFTGIKTTKASGDYGADIIAFKSKSKYAIQCKYYSRPVGVKAVQEVIGARGYYKADVAMVITNSTFTASAIKLANSNGVILKDAKYCSALEKAKPSRNSNQSQLEKRYHTAGCGSVVLLFIVLFIVFPLMTGRCSKRESSDNVVKTTAAAETERNTETEQETSDAVLSEYIFPYSDTILLTEDDIDGMSKEEIQLAINEIYARAGREFKGDNGEYFSTKSWYDPQYDKDYFSAHQYELLNEVEQANITFLVKYR